MIKVLKKKKKVHDCLYGTCICISFSGVYTAEKISDMSWAFLSLGWLYFFHFVPLNYLAVVSSSNQF